MVSAQSRLLDIFREYASNASRIVLIVVDPKNKDRLTLEGIVCFFEQLQVDVETVIYVLPIVSDW